MTATTEPRAEDVAPKICRNCGAPVDGAYCATCGQETALRLPTLREFLREAAGRYVALDGRFWRTVFSLLARPGFLTREYLAGRRRRYIRPARLYLFATLIFFAVTRLLVGPIDIFEVRPDTPEEAKYLSPDKGFNLQVDSDSVFGSPALQKRWNRFNNLSKSEKAEQLGDGILRYAPYAMFVLLPAFALLLKLVYLGRGRRYPRRPRLYGEHLVFAGQEVSGDFVVVGIGVGDWAGGAVAQLIDAGVGVGHDDGRMGGDQELRAGGGQIVQAREKGELALRRERGFGLIEEVEAGADEAVLEEGEE